MTAGKARVLTTATLLALACALTACGNGGTDNTETTDTSNTTVMQPPGSQPQYFGDQGHVGEQVTITVPVATNLTEGSLVLDARAYGDENLLVLFNGDQQQFTEGQTVTASGTVRQFSYDEYADQYGLGEAVLFEVYANENFLAADTITAEAPPST